MTKAREEQISLEATPYYHCMVRCVRRAYLCGEDPISGNNYDHRKQWLVSRMRFLSYVYAIDICAYAVMSNHYHMVLHVDEARAAEWSAHEVAERWMQVFNGHMLVDRWLAGEKQTKAELDAVFDLIETWRARLSSISWFMRCMNETIACMANEEDNCSGRFWEGRFKSQALLDDVALLTCMTYVDLNPVRAAMADTPENSDFTAIQQRLFDAVKRNKTKTREQKALVKRVIQQKTLESENSMHDLPKAKLMSFDGSSHTSIHCALPFTEQDYFHLIDAAGRAIRDDKRGFITETTPPILIRLGIDEEHWLDQIRSYGRSFSSCVGSAERIREYAASFDRSWHKGIKSADSLYRRVA